MEKFVGSGIEEGHNNIKQDEGEDKGEDEVKSPLPSLLNFNAIFFLPFIAKTHQRFDFANVKFLAILRVRFSIPLFSDRLG